LRINIKNKFAERRDFIKKFSPLQFNCIKNMTFINIMLIAAYMPYSFPNERIVKLFATRNNKRIFSIDNAGFFELGFKCKGQTYFRIVNEQII